MKVHHNMTVRQSELSYSRMNICKVCYDNQDKETCLKCVRTIREVYDEMSEQ